MCSIGIFLTYTGSLLTCVYGYNGSLLTCIIVVITVRSSRGSAHLSADIEACSQAAPHCSHCAGSCVEALRCVYICMPYVIWHICHTKRICNMQYKTYMQCMIWSCQRPGSYSTCSNVRFLLHLLYTVILHLLYKGILQWLIKSHTWLAV